ncbi:ribonuclease H-like domain-containing protein, partial [Tanacetum coccineum]
IRCENGTEFKNMVMNQFCEMKGIKREFIVARTPQQNGLAERKNRTLIEAARTILADSKLPTTFWAEVVNTACYVQNRIENTSNIVGSGPNWLFDIDALTKSMNYKPVVAGNPSNGNAGTKACDDAGKAKEEKKDSADPGNEDSEVPSTEEPRVNQEKDANVNSTNNINNFSPTDNATGIEDNVVDENIVYGCADDLNMPELEDIVYSDDDEDVGAEADMINLDTFMPVSSIPTTRIHKDHPASLSQEEPKKVVQVLKDPSWIEAMQEELLQFKLQEVWTLVELPNGKRAIGTKWVFRKKKDERVFSPVARIEAIRLFLAYASFKDFVVYRMDVKSAFFMKEDGIFISQDKYVNGILNKFGFSDVKTASTPMETHKTLLKDEKVEDVDEHLYRSMIGAFMYLTSSRLDMRAREYLQQIIHKGWLKWNATTTGHGIEVKIDKDVHKERGDRVERDATTATSLDAEQDSGNINRTQSTAMPNDPLP